MDKINLIESNSSANLVDVLLHQYAIETLELQKQRLLDTLKYLHKESESHRYYLEKIKQLENSIEFLKHTRVQLHY